MVDQEPVATYRLLNNIDRIYWNRIEIGYGFLADFVVTMVRSLFEMVQEIPEIVIVIVVVIAIEETSSVVNRCRVANHCFDVGYSTSDGA